MAKKSSIQENNSRLSNEKLDCIAELGKTSAWISNRYTEFLQPYGISPQQFNILRVLRRTAEWTTMNTVKELLIVKSPNTTRLTDKLVVKKLVKRKRSSTDRRMVFVHITDSGLELLEELDKQHEGPLSEYMDQFTVEEAILMTQILKRIRE